MSSKSDCYACARRRDIPGDAHNQARLLNWHYNFDPVWLSSCTGYAPKRRTSDVLGRAEVRARLA